MTILESALQNFSRNLWLSITSIVVIFLMVLSLGSFLTLNIIADKLIDSLNQKMDIEIYLNQNASSDQINLFRSELENMKEVKNIQYVSPEETLKQFKEKYQDNPVIKKSLEELEENPFGPSLKIKLVKPGDFNKALEVINKTDYQPLIYNKDFYDYEQILNIFSKLNKKFYTFALFLGSFFTFIAILIIFATIKIAIYSRQDEIKIMRLVGAKNFAIQGPFILEGCFYALFGWGIFLCLWLSLIKTLSPQIQKFLGFNFDIASYLQSNSFFFFGSLLVFSLIIAIISSWIATKKYLKI